MAYQQLDRRDEAKRFLATALEWTDVVLAADAETGSTDLPWDHRLTLQLMREEAKRMPVYSELIAAANTPRHSRTSHPAISFAYLQRAMAFAASGRLDDAIAGFEEAIAKERVLAERSPDAAAHRKNAADLQAALAQAYISRGYDLWLGQGPLEEAVICFSKAIPILRQLVADYPDEPQYQADLAVACKAHGKASGNEYRERSMQDLTEAIDICRKLVAAFPDVSAQQFGWRPSHILARALSWRTLLLTEAGKLDEAIFDGTEAIASDPTISEAYRLRANAYMTKGDVEKAIADLREAIRINPKDGQAQTELSNLLDKMNDHQDPKPKEKRESSND